MFRSLIVLSLVFVVLGQDVKGEYTSVDKGVKVNISDKDSANFILCVNGVLYGSESIKLLNFFDSSKITSINVVKGKEAKRLFNTEKSVISIVMKESINIRKANDSSSDSPKSYSNGMNRDFAVGYPTPNSRIESGLEQSNDMETYFFIEDKRVSKEDIEKLDRGTIESITRVEGESAKELYKLEGRVIIITLKK